MSASDSVVMHFVEMARTVDEAKEYPSKTTFRGLPARAENRRSRSQIFSE